MCPEDGCEEVLGVEDVQRGVLVWRKRSGQEGKQGEEKMEWIEWWLEGVE